MIERHHAYRFELDPNNRVRTLLYKHAGVARFVYNWSLARRIERFKTQEGKLKFTNAREEHKALTALKATDFPWMYEVSKCAPQEALRDLDRAFKSFWARRKEGVGFPHFKKKYVSRDSFRLYESIKVQDRYVQLPRLGTIRTKEKIAGRVKGRILSATVSREADRWFVSLAVIEEVQDVQPVGGPTVGVDLGLKTFAVISDGMKVSSPSPLRASLKRLARAQRRHSRKKKGSNNRKKSAQKIARIHTRVANVRKDFLHKFTTMLAKTKSVIVIEDLNVKNMSRNHCLARSISDQGWGETRRQLTYKTTWYGSRLVVADRWFPSSKMCSACGLKRTELALSVREWACEGCGVIHDRDENAAKNLEGYPEFSGEPGIAKSSKPVEIPLTAEREAQASWTTSHESLNQEANIKMDSYHS